MLELQSIQKEQKRRELLAKLQKEENSAEVPMPLKKAIKNGTNPSDELRLNNNRDTLRFENDTNDDDIGTTVADDIILMKMNANVAVVENESTSATLTVIYCCFLMRFYILKNINFLINSHKILSPTRMMDLTQIQCQLLTKQIIAVQIQLLPKSTMCRLQTVILAKKVYRI